MASAYGATNNVKLQENGDYPKYEYKTIFGFARHNRYESILVVLAFVFMIVFNILSNAICGIGEKPICKQQSAK